jgi:SAM-dependent methyltransferase
MSNDEQNGESQRQEVFELKRALEDTHQTLQKFTEQAQQYEETIRKLSDQVTARETQLNAILSSRAWRWVNRYGRIKKRFFPSAVSAVPQPPPAAIVRRTTAQEIFYSLPGELVPPPELQALIGGGFRGTGPEFLKYFRELCDLRPDAKVLDVGCGSGRMAVPLASYLSEHGAYEGFDVSRPAIEWCSENITPRFPNFHFQVADVANPTYNAEAKSRASDYVFPYADDYFDLVFLTSVFTHMMPADMEPYLAEVSRVLKPGGRCLITFFLLNPESRQLMTNHAETYFTPNLYLSFPHQVAPGCQAVDPKRPEDALAYDESYMRELFTKYRLTIAGPIHYGSWCGRQEYLSLQDIVVAVKNASAV